MQKKIFLLLLVLSFSASVFAQQDHQYTQFMYNKLLINPAYAGARGVPSVTGIYRNQWVGFDGSPQSALLSFNSTFLSERVGVGLTLSNQSAGLNRDFFGQVAYSYDLVGSKNLSLRVGVQGSLRSQSVAFNEAQPITIGDPATDINRATNILGNVGAGVYATISQRLYIGLSVPRLYANKIGFNPNPGNLQASESVHFYGIAGAVIPLSDDINFLPAVMLKYVKNAPFDADINLNLEIREKITAGLSYRPGGDGSGESIDMLVFWQATPQFGVGAAYDFSLSQIRDYTAGSIEVMVQADLKKKKKTMSNPRFFL